MSTLEALHHVLNSGSKTEILKILGCKTDLQHQYQNGDTVYHVIIGNEKLKEEEIISISEIVLNRGVNTNTKNQRDLAPVHLAIEKRMRKVANFLSNYNPSLFGPQCQLTKFFVEHENVKFWDLVKQRNSWNSEKYEHESASFLEWLLSKEFDSQNGRRIIDSDLLKSPVTNNLQHILLALLENISAVYTYKSGFSDLFNEFFRAIIRARIRHNGKRSDVWYSKYNSRYTAKIVKNFLAIGAIIDNCLLTYVSSAITHKVLYVIKMLVDGFPDNHDDQTSATKLLQTLMKHPCTDLSGSEIQCYLEILRDLASKGVDVVGVKLICRGDSPLQLAVKAQNIRAAEFFKEIKADFGMKTYWGQNLLHLLYQHRSKEQKMCEWLVNVGVDINGRANGGKTPLHYAVKHENAALAEKLIELGADINCRDNENQSSLHYAVFHNKTTELIQLLLERGAKVNAKDMYGRKPLFFAIFSYSRGYWLDAMQLLLKSGADVKAIFALNNGMTAGRVCADAVEELLKYGLDSFPDSYLFQCCGSQIKTLLKRHCLKLKAANLLVAKNFAHSLHTAVDHQFYEECLREVHTLKGTFIESRTSLYAYLHMDSTSRCIYNNDVELKMLVNTYELKMKFPIYAVPILARYREAIARKSLLEPAKSAWVELTQITLPDICIERIFSYLDVADLKDIVDMV